MFKIGEVRRAKEINHRGRGLWIWLLCPQCNIPRWVYKQDTKPSRKSASCRTCSGKRYVKLMQAKNWKGGRTYRNGYAFIKLYPPDPFYSMAKGSSRYIAEHRLIMAQHLGRLLKTTEIVHHINGVRADNRIENLEIITPHEHPKQYTAGYVEGYKQAIIDVGNTVGKETAEVLGIWRLMAETSKKYATVVNQKG